MSTVSKKIMMGSGAGDSAYEIDQSLIFDAPSYTGLVMSSGNDGNHRKWTWSGWVKKAENLLTSTSHNNEIFASTSSDGNTLVQLSFYQDTLYWVEYDASAGGNKGHFQTNRVFRDPAAWYHIVVVYDSAQGSASDRIKAYINGVRETSFAAFLNVPENYDSSINTASIPLKIGNDYGYIDGSQAQYGYNGNIAEVHYLDGTSYDASYFGETNSDTGQWIPKEYTGGNYSTNGFYLKFVSGAIGTDSSGEGNNFTVTNLANADVVTDTPTNNCMTLNFLDTGSSTLSEGNLKLVTSNHSDTSGTMRLPNTGKWYWEVTCTTVGGTYFGIYKTSYTQDSGSWVTGSHIVLIGSTGQKLTQGSSAATYMSGAVSNGDVVGVAVDCDNGKIFFADSNTWGDSGNPATGANPAGTFTASDGWKPGFYGPGGANAINLSLNFGQKTFSYTPPSGFSALTASNLSSPAIALPSAHFNPHIYTGSNNTDAITGVGFQPDLVWVKQRDVAYNHQLHDAARGAAAGLFMSDNDAAENSSYPIASFDSDGFTPASGNVTGVNTGSMVGWFWKANGAGSSNTDGSINTTKTSANTTSGFSICTYTGTGSNATIGHGLGVAPELVIVKNRGVADPWAVLAMAGSDETDYLVLSTTAAVADDATYWNDTAPTSSVFSIGTAHNVNASSETYVAYCFASKDAYSSIGSYTGNGSADGPMIVTDFRPALVITKRTDATGYWGIFDATRAPLNVAAFPALFPNTNDAEVTGTYLDLLSNGFKIRIDSTHYNADGGTYLYMAFAESPFKYANAR